MRLLAFLDLSLVDEHGFVDDVVEEFFVDGAARGRPLGRLETQKLSGNPRIERLVSDRRPTTSRCTGSNPG
jgi:hypothetical protein